MKPDLALQQSVMRELQWDPVLRASEISVLVKHGVVRLTGTVNSYSRKLAAEHAARRVEGIKAVAMDINVRQPSDIRKTDAEIADAVRRALRWHSFLPEEQITASVKNGWVTLNGEVERHFQRETAVKAVRYMAGVQGVTSRIGLKPQITAAAVKSVIRQVLEKRAGMESDGVKVVVHGGKVTLTGKVSSRMAMNDIIQTIAGMPGVTGVVDELVIAP